jgi:hypothetical protein
LAEVGEGERIGNSTAHREWFRRLFPISPLSTGLLPKILLPRLGGEVHTDQVIGTEVPASPEGPETAKKGAAGDRRTDLRRQAIGKSFRVLLGASREEAPEESIFSSATRLPGFFGTLVSEAGRRRDRPKKGRGKSGGFGPQRFWSSDRKCSGCQAGPVERPASLRAT